MKLAFLGLPLAALLLARDGHEIAWAGVCRKGALGTRRLKKLVPALEIVPDLGKRDVAERIAAAKPELLVSWFWTKKIPKSVLAIAPRTVGVHPSLLPRHRGPDPYFWAIDAGDEVTGVTAHVLAEEYDTGAVYAKRELAIDPAWNAWTLAKKLDRPSLALLRDVVRAMPEPIPQDESGATEAPQPTDDDLAVVWTWPAERIARRVRAAAPWPGMTTWLGDDEEVVLTRVQTTHDVPRALEPGEGAVVGGVAVVRAADAGVALLAGRSLDEEELGPDELARRLFPR